jgi:hypothetical protein
MANHYKRINTAATSGGSGGNPPYDYTFLIATWILDGDGYYITLPESSHNRGNHLSVTVYEDVAGLFEEIDVFIEVTSGGNITIRVPVDNRFDGKMIIIGE